MIPSLSVIIAAFNEEAVLGQNIQSVIATLQEREAISWELILINDGSNDATGEIMEQAAAGEPRVRVWHQRHNGGQGLALQQGFALARGDVFITLDADLSYHPRHLWLLWDALHQHNADLALASAYMAGGSVQHVPLLRALLSRWGNRYLALFHPYPLATYTCVVRAYRREVLDRLYLTSPGMEMQVEILTKAAMLELPVVEIPAHLAWSSHKVQVGMMQRKSKMHIGRSIRLYLQWGWFSRPAWPVAWLAGLLFIPGMVLAGLLVGGAVQGWTVMLWTGLLLFSGLFLGAMALLFLQNRHHFQESYLLQQTLLKHTILSTSKRDTP